jgi:hypothetical protein
MSAIETMRNRVHVILAKHFGVLDANKHGEFRIQNESAHVFLSIDHGFGSQGLVIKVNCPMVSRVALSPELFRWISVEGRDFPLGGVYLVPHANGTHGEVWFGHSFVADDLDEKELLGSLYPILVFANDLDDQLVQRFGGELFTK